MITLFAKTKTQTDVLKNSILSCAIRGRLWLVGLDLLRVSVAQTASTCSKLTIGTLEQGAKYVQSLQ